MPVAWVEKLLRGTRVWMQSDEAGQPITGPDERVEIVYKPGGKPYRASVHNLDAVADARPVTDEALVAQSSPGPREKRSGAATAGTAAVATDSASTAAPRERAPRKTSKRPPPGDAVHVYTDGACTGNPGPMGIGIVIFDGPDRSAAARREISQYLGQGTNNIAELTAIEVGLASLTRDRSVVVYSDSSYAIGLLAQGWRARANQELVARLRALLQEFPHVAFVKVAGHSGHPENERCDELARTAIVKRSSSRHEHR